MNTSKNILIVSHNTVLAAGLTSLLEHYFPPDHIFTAAAIHGPAAIHHADYIVLQPDMYALHLDLLLRSKKRIIVLTEQDAERPHHSAIVTLNCMQPETAIVQQLEEIFSAGSKKNSDSGKEELSSREIDVLKLVARGCINKQIADKLFISLHTVISHRKNITRKLGIKTVSGLTVYALLNGLISSKDVG